MSKRNETLCRVFQVRSRGVARSRAARSDRASYQGARAEEGWGEEAARVVPADEECEDESTETPQYYEYGENVSRRKRDVLYRVFFFFFWFLFSRITSSALPRMASNEIGKSDAGARIFAGISFASLSYIIAKRIYISFSESEARNAALRGVGESREALVAKILCANLLALLLT